MPNFYHGLALIVINLADCFANSNLILGRDNSLFDKGTPLGDLDQPLPLDGSTELAFNDLPNENLSSDFLSDDLSALLLPKEDLPSDLSTDNLFSDENSSFDLLASDPLFDLLASNPSSDLLASDPSSSGCLSPFLPSGKLRVRGSDFCADHSNPSESQSQSESQPAAITEEKVRDFWCGNQGLLGFSNIPVCSTFDDFYELARLPVERYLDQYLRRGYSRDMDVWLDNPSPGQVEQGFTVILHCRLRKSRSIPSYFPKRKRKLTIELVTMIL